MSAEGWDGILEADEKIVWQGQPDGAFRLRGKNIAISVFGLFFLGFSLFWTLMAGVGSGQFMPSFVGLLFVFVGLFLVVGIHWLDAAARRKTHYTLTTRHAFIATDFLGKRLKSYPIDGDTVLDFRPGTPGSLFFAKELRRGKNGTYRIPVGFELIPDAEGVYRKFRDVQAGLA